MRQLWLAAIGASCSTPPTDGMLSLQHFRCACCVGHPCCLPFAHDSCDLSQSCTCSQPGPSSPSSSSRVPPRSVFADLHGPSSSIRVLRPLPPPSLATFCAKAGCQGLQGGQLRHSLAPVASSAGPSGSWPPIPHLPCASASHPPSQHPGTP